FYMAFRSMGHFTSYLPHCKRTSIMTPPGLSKCVHKLVIPIFGFGHILPDIFVFMCQDNEYIIGIWGLGNPELYVDGIIIFFPSTKETVEYIEDATVVFIHIFNVLGVVYLVHSMGVQELFNKSHFFNILGVQLELPQGFNSQTNHQHFRGEADDYDPYIE